MKHANQSSLKLKANLAWKTALGLSLSIGLMISGNLTNTARVEAQDGSSGTSIAGSSAGSPGMADTEYEWQSMVAKAAKHSTTDSAYAESLLELGMHYNRHEKYATAARSLKHALELIDKGAIKKPVGPAPALKPPTVKQDPDGTVSATNNNVPDPYDATMENLLPALVFAEIKTRALASAEIHATRMLKLAKSGRIPEEPALMHAYNQCAEIFELQGQHKKAEEYKTKAEKLRQSIVGL